MKVRIGRHLNVIFGHPQYIRLGRPQDVRSGRPRDGQIESLEDILETLEEDVLGMFWDQYLLVGLLARVCILKTSGLYINVNNSRVPGRYNLTWFFNNVINVKLTEHGRIHKIFHVTDIENLWKTDNLEEYNNNASF